MKPTISVCNWDDFQHYRDRDPPWIKLYRDILTSETWLLGTDTVRLVQIASILLAARYKNEIPFNMELIKSAAHLGCEEDAIQVAIMFLAGHKFLEIHNLTNFPVESASTLLAKCSTTNPVLYSEQVRASQSRASQSRDMSAQEADPVVVVFQHWQHVWHKQRSALDPKRRALIAKALKSYSVVDLGLCISGYNNSDWHRGQNDRNCVYDDIGLFLRDSAHIDKGIALASAPILIQPKTLTTADLLARGDTDELE